MRDLEDGNWFSQWEEELPPPEDLMPLSQTLITPDLAVAFDIRNPFSANGNPSVSPSPSQNLASNHLPPSAVPSPHPGSSEFADSGELVGGGGAGDEPARTLKRPRLVWTPQLHKRFVDAVAHLGIKNAVPKTIMQLMSVDGLTRENVASHLQKYRLYLKRMQGISGGGGGSGVGADPATEHLFASSPVPAHFLGPNAEHYIPFVSVPTNHPRHQQMTAAAAYHRPMGHFGSPPNRNFEHPFLSRQAQQPVHRMGPQLHGNGNMQPYIEDLESPVNNTNGGGRKVLTLFPTGED